MTGEARKKIGRLNVFFLAAVAVVLSTPFIGIENIGPFDLSPETVKGKIFWKIRVPRVMLAFLAGAGLGVCGMAFQAVFRNPLATPFTLGVASGASLGAAIYLAFGMSFTVLGLSGASFFSIAGAVISILLVYGITRVRRGFSVGGMLLAGVAVSFFFSSVIMFMQYISDFTRSFLILRWLMGGLDVVGYDLVINVTPFVLLGTAVVFYLSRELNLLTAGEDLAISRGVDAGKTKALLFFSTSMMVGGIVAACGPIGFVGMMAPHICRLIIGSDHGTLAPATLLFGGSFLVLCDTLARTVIAPAEIPVGVITALLGGPFFLWILAGKSSKITF